MTGTVTKGLIQRQDMALWDGISLAASRTSSTGGTTTGNKINDWVDVLEVYGGGDAYTSGSIQSAVNAVGSSNVGFIFAPGTWSISANVTVPANVTCIVPAGVVFDVDSGVTLTIAGVFFRMHGTYSSGDGTVTISGSDLLAAANSNLHYAADTGSADSYAMAPSPAISSYSEGQIFRFKASNANTGASTLNVNSKGAKDIKKDTSAALEAGDIASGQMIECVYDGTNMQMVPTEESINTGLDLGTAAQKNHGTSSGQIALIGTEPTGDVVQVVTNTDSTYTSITTLMPTDNTIPQNTEGDEYITLAITPTNASNKLIIDVVLNMTASSNLTMAMGLFQDSTANALAAIAQGVSAASFIESMVLRYTMTAGTASSTTFKVRAGPGASGTMYLNGNSSASVLGSKEVSSIIITEVKV